MSQTVRVATGPSDALLMAAIQEEASLAGLDHIFPPASYPFPREVVQELWRKFSGQARFLEISGKPVGFCAVTPPWLQGLYVLPSHWGKGIAPRLLLEAVNLIRATGAREAHLWALEKNDRARAFYEKQGWIPDGTSRVVEYPPHPTDVGYTLKLL